MPYGTGDILARDLIEYVSFAFRCAYTQIYMQNCVCFCWVSLFNVHRNTWFAVQTSRKYVRVFSGVYMMESSGFKSQQRQWDSLF